MIKKLAIVVLVLLLGAVAIVVLRFGPRNVLGMIRYDQRQEGSLRVGDLAPDVELVAPDGARRLRVKDLIGGKPLVLVFGSYT
jgi:cytochrome oxidase Cu insertion factor (SCO1/SenC/PrrC family)